MENYILVAICYGVGCYLSYKLGLDRGKAKAGICIINVIARHFKMPAHQVANQILAMADSQIEESKKALS